MARFVVNGDSKMSNYPFVARTPRLMLQLGAAAAFTLCLVQCSAEQPGDTADEPNLGSVSQALEQCGGKTCTAPADCLSGMPVCALSSGATCYGGTECTYKLNTTSPGCPCIQHDVRLCTIAGSGAPGVQICTKVTSTATTWAACTTTPACTP
jgi:hypothetical protein